MGETPAQGFPSGAEIFCGFSADFAPKDGRHPQFSAVFAPKDGRNPRFSADFAPKDGRNPPPPEEKEQQQQDVFCFFFLFFFKKKKKKKKKKKTRLGFAAPGFGAAGVLGGAELRLRRAGIVGLGAAAG